ncbi:MULTISPECIES: 4-hydroxy-tetrahydrodipicolinate synthase [unclassified Butyrivibrio]|uniref:4-hydroxy-tetrahydrodipicolinate synthase n=1 Tax=unclassified Butyrivibrio TaxID=2639466 RepID=UPI0003B6DDE8|nr:MULTISPECIES: 4-hydroxy-tetrahydrodipicolinate synthase [unclassified Butyrivibrio]MBE5836932.1 4-hydroxy-tetrahydrodipicolinate synthase [Butyrivibrio sp.]MBP3819825.1 4-hydroxy-tetrahydrodipicolinate synthase [Butyrivibrio sp.]MBQ9306005.1 4-hydroxy-tetrahydrodipicolinate synthase [Butyrivibrio sp.]SEF78288.1 4-hydroxy-tetrahydrodipicolinate synthase [Butyrivibrio sp. Su6]
MAIFKGAGVAIATPFKENGEVNYEEFERLIEFQIENGTDAIIVCGTTGEAATMSEEEHMDVVKFCIDKVAKRIPVIAGTGSNCTETAVKLSKLAEEYGADGLLLVTPYYNKATQGGLIAHFSAVAKEVNIPIILYNVPSRTGCNILPETAVKLAREYKNIVGIKDATGNISQTTKMMQLAEGCIDLYSGDDDQIVPIMSIGGLGVISVLSNIAPRQTHEICQKCLEGDYAAARELQFKAFPLVKALFSEVNPIPVKSALKMVGFAAGPLRLPLTEMEPENQEKLRAEMKKFGLI